MSAIAAIAIDGLLALYLITETVNSDIFYQGYFVSSNETI